MLGHYENFPETVHGIAHFTHKASMKAVQQAVVAAFTELNQKKYKLEEIARSSGSRCDVDFEIGVGEQATFTFLETSEVERLKEEVAKRTLPLLDFLFVLQYHAITESGTRSPLKFDYYLMRFAFAKNLTEFLVSHERGPRRVHVEDLVCFVAKHVTMKFAEHYSGSLKLEDQRTA